MSGEGWNEKDDMFVDFSGDKRTKEKIKDRAAYTEYDNVDLASGYPKSQIWTTKDGRRIAIPNMSDDHLLNTIAYLRRREEDYKKMHIARIAAGMAEMTAVGMIFDAAPFWGDREFEDAMAKAKEIGLRIYAMGKEEWLRKYAPHYVHLLTECYKRKLLIEVDRPPTEIGRRYGKGQ